MIIVHIQRAAHLGTHGKLGLYLIQVAANVVILSDFTRYVQ